MFYKIIKIILNYVYFFITYFQIEKWSLMYGVRLHIYIVYCVEVVVYAKDYKY